MTLRAPQRAATLEGEDGTPGERTARLAERLRALAAAALDLPAERLLLRKELADLDIELRLRLQNSRRGHLQRKVVVVRRLNQAIERRVVEQLLVGAADVEAAECAGGVHHRGERDGRASASSSTCPPIA